MNASNFLKCFLVWVGLCVFYQGAHAGDCDLPPGVSVSGKYITGAISVNLGSNKSAQINLFVQNKIFSDGRCAAKVYRGAEALWQSLYNDYVNSGMTFKNIQILADSISGKETAGIYIEEGIGACGYNGFDKTITCGPSSDPSQKGVMAHENMHGWQFQFVLGPNGIQYYLAFAHFANLVYEAEQSNKASLSGTLNGKKWNLDYLTYGLQSEEEWGAEVFSDWLLGTTSGAVWPYIVEHQSAYVEYFNCLWKTDTSPSECALLLNLPMRFAEVDPTLIPPGSVTTKINVPGQGSKTVTFSQTQSQAIWNVCFNEFKGTATSNDFKTLQALIDEVSPGLPDDAAHYYKLMYADANHDNVIDWLCKYSGPGPSGVGNGEYLWNKENKDGTYTFLISGKGADDYVEYKQDPYLTLPSMAGGAIAQPQFREWQGQFGSANGAKTFHVHGNYPWYPIFASRITNIGKRWMIGPACGSCDPPLSYGSKLTVNCPNNKGVKVRNDVFFIPTNAPGGKESQYNTVIVNYEEVKCGENDPLSFSVSNPYENCAIDLSLLRTKIWFYAETQNGRLRNITCSFPNFSKCPEVKALTQQLDDLYKKYAKSDNRKGQGQKANLKKMITMIQTNLDEAKKKCLEN
jgi:hypothetical protein